MERQKGPKRDLEAELRHAAQHWDMQYRPMLREWADLVVQLRWDMLFERGSAQSDVDAELGSERSEES